MKTENKCFFSISLENGITITGNNPKEVKNFLSDLMMCIKNTIESRPIINPNWEEHLNNLNEEIKNAWFTICRNNEITRQNLNKL